MDIFEKLIQNETHEHRRDALRYSVMALNLGAPAVEDTASIVADGDMKNGAYTIAAQPDAPRTISMTVTKVTANDTMGKITFTGTDALDQAITEEVAPNNGDTSSGYTETTKAFKTVNSITGSGWAISAGTDNDQIQLGYGKKIGLPIALSTINNVILCLLDRAVQAHTPAVGDPGSVAETVIDASAGTYDGTKVMQVLVTARG